MLNCFLLLNLAPILDCTIDMTMAHFKYIASQLTPEECRQLVASLHFTSYELPESLTAAEKKVPLDIECLNLLLKWNSGGEKWEGRGKTHEIVVRRLRQLYKPKLANWVGTAVFQQLIQDIDETLLNDSYIQVTTEPLPTFIAPTVPDKYIKAGQKELMIFDFTLVFIIMTFVGGILLVCRILYMAFLLFLKLKSGSKEVEEDELKDLLSNDFEDLEAGDDDN